MRLGDSQRVTAELAERRALACMGRTPRPAADIAALIWPGHSMKPQGAGAAAARVLKRLQRRGLVELRSNRRISGWVKKRGLEQRSLFDFD